MGAANVVLAEANATPTNATWAHAPALVLARQPALNGRLARQWNLPRVPLVRELVGRRCDTPPCQHATRVVWTSRALQSAERNNTGKTAAYTVGDRPSANNNGAR